MKCCGNCKNHSIYEYPRVVFCFYKLKNDEEPVKSVFAVCNDWELKEQECFCCRDANNGARVARLEYRDQRET